MSHPKRDPKLALTIRISQALYEKLEAESVAQGWAINDEINFRLRSAMSGERVTKLESEVAELKAMIKALAEK